MNLEHPFLNGMSSLNPFPQGYKDIEEKVESMDDTKEAMSSTQIHSSRNVSNINLLRLWKYAQVLHTFKTYGSPSAERSK